MLKTIVFSLFGIAVTSAQSAVPTNASTGYSGPGVVIDHSPASLRIYLGSPAIATLFNGDYLAKCDEFGPASTNTKHGISLLFRSTDHGEQWQQIARVEDIYWASLFTHGNDVYLMGTTAESGAIAIRRSTDGGSTWSQAKDDSTGLLREGHFHTGPCPVLEHAGRIWRAYEENAPASQTAGSTKAFIMSAPADSNLLDNKNWTYSEQLNSEKSWLDGTFSNWQEGNALAATDGSIVDVLRVNQPQWPEKAAIIDFGHDGKTPRFDPENDLVNLPGAGKRFTIRFDDKSKLYWSITNDVPADKRTGDPASHRNTLVLVSSPDLHVWTTHATLLHADDAKKHAFQYCDWQFEGEDLIAVVRTAAYDNAGGAHSFHDNNYLELLKIAS